MSQWKSDDSAANSVLWGPSQLKLPANSANRDTLFGNSSADAYVTGATIGTYGVDDDEATYDLFKIIGVTPGANLGVDVIPTTNSTTAFTAPGTGATNATVNVESVVISSVAVNAAGQAYTNGDIVSLDEGEGTAATFEVTANATGNVTDLTIVSVGYYANGDDLPAGDSTTTAVTGSGNSLVVDITTGVGVMSIADVGSYTATPDISDLELTADGGQTGANVLVNATVSKTGAKQGLSGGPGHVLVTDGSGGRAGRVTGETLVCITSMTGDDEDTKFPNT